MSRLRSPTARKLRVAIPIAVPFLVLAWFVIRGWDTGTFPDLHAPADTPSTVPPPSTAPVDLTAIVIPAVNGTTTTAPVRSHGTARLTGVVNGPQGRVPGAVVRLDHFAGAPTSTEVTAGPDGRYDAPNIAGGRYRVRAFLAPTFAQTDPEVFFLTDGEQRTLDLSVGSFAGLAVTSAVAPDPPMHNDPVTLAVRVSVRSVDARGIVQVQPVVNATVTLTAAQDWSVSGPSSAATNDAGDATFTLVCRTAGANQVQVEVRPTAIDPPQPASLDLPACVAAPTTTSAPQSTGSSGSSSSSGQN